MSFKSLLSLSFFFLLATGTANAFVLTKVGKLADHGLQVGDKVISINGKKVDEDRIESMKTLYYGTEKKTVLIDRNGQLIEVKIDKEVKK